MSTLDVPQGQFEFAATPGVPEVRELLDQLPLPLLLLDDSSRILWWNRAAEELSGQQRGTAPRMRWGEDLLVMLDGGRPFLRHHEGHLFPVRVQQLAYPRTAPEGAKSLVCVTDATPSLSILEYARRFPELDLTDPLTNLGNRRLASLEVETHLIRYQLHRRNFGAMLFDVDLLHEVNERFGYDCSDHALAAVARTLSGCLDEPDTICRWGGDQFLALAVGDLERVEGKAELCRRAVENSRLEWKGQAVALTVSAGIELAMPGTRPEELLGHAEFRLRMSKRLGRNRITSCRSDQAE